VANSPPPDASRTGVAALVALIGTAAAAILVPTVAQWEGKSNDPYLDLIGKATVCYGETRVEMRHYTDAECEEMLAEGLADFAKPVLSCTPSLKDRPNALAASISLAYNIGTAGYCRSTAARRFRAGDIAGGCNAFLMWRYAGGREIRGLLNRRKAERAICIRDSA
jgi:lysozyme